MKKYAVIVAGGKGLRMGTAVSKQFLPLQSKPILYHTIKAFVDAYADVQLILVLPSDQVSYAQMVLEHFSERIDVTIVTGGPTRFHSVQNGLKQCSADSVIFVHDGVRPLVTADLIQRCYEQALAKGTAIPAIKVTDSMRLVDGDDSEPISRDALRIIQTPQTFRADILLPAFAQEYAEKFTDEATVVEANGMNVDLIEGERSNIKVTTPEDLLIAEALLQNQNAKVKS